MRVQHSLIVIAVACALVPLMATNVPGYPVSGERWELRQPDGSMVSVRIWGDEYYQVVESLDGYTLVRDPSNQFICYARLSVDGNRLESTGVRVGAGDPKSNGLRKHLRINTSARIEAIKESRKMRRSRIGATSEDMSPARVVAGEVKGLVVLVDFDDEPATLEQSEIERMFNNIGYSEYGNNGSVRDYFRDVSEGVLDFTNWVSPTYYRAQYSFSHYDDCSRPWPEGARELTVEILDHLESTGLDFTQFDADADGEIDALAVMYAGFPQCGWAQGLWPGSGGLYEWWTSASGITTGRGLWIGTWNTPSIGGFCHESGHMVCHWPDLYDYHGDSKGVGQYCLMANFASHLNPVEPCAYLKYRAGWGDVTTLTSPEQGLGLPASSTNAMFKYEHPVNANEYFLVENRRQSGRDAAVPDDGLAVWHIDTEGWNSWNQMLPDQHFMVTLVQADGLWDLENNANSGDDTDLYAAPIFTELSPYPQANPSSRWWDGNASGMHLENISESAPTMTLDFDINNSAEVSVGHVATVSRNKSTWVFRADLANAGPGNAYNVVAVVSEDLPWLEVRKAACKYREVRAGGDALPRDVHVLATDTKSWPESPFSVDMHVTWEDPWGSEYADTVTFTFHSTAAVSVAGGNAVADGSSGKPDFTRQPDASRLPGKAVAHATRLERNHPNPFNPTTTIPYRIASSTRVGLSIYDAAGRLVRQLVNETQPPGDYAVTWNGRDDAGRFLPSGVYFCRLLAGGSAQTRKMVLLK